MKRKKRVENIFLTISMGTFLMSLTQTAFMIDKSDSDSGSMHSLLALLTGWLALFSSPAGTAWVANPLLVLSWFFISRNIRKALIASILATAASASFLLFGEIISDEAGHTSEIIGYGSGYWLWLISCCSFMIGTAVLYIAGRNQQQTTP